MAQDSVERYENEGGEDEHEGRDGRLILAAAEDADDGIGVEGGAGDASGSEEENETDVLDEKVAVFVMGVGGVVGESGEHDVDDTVDGHNEHVLDLGDELVDADDVVRCEESEEDHVGLRVHTGGDA